MSGGSSLNSWTIVSPEETVAETLKPLAKEVEHHEESLTSESDEPESGKKQPTESGAESAEELSEGGHQVSQDRTLELSGHASTEPDTVIPRTITEAPVTTSTEVPSVPGDNAFSQSEGLPKGPPQSDKNPDSFSDSSDHINPSSDSPPATLLSPETIGGVEFTKQERKLHPLSEEEPLKGDESYLSERITDGEKQSESPVDSEVVDQRTDKTGEELEPQVRRRRSLLAALDRIGRAEEEEEVDEEFQLPQQQEDSGLSLNKCILGALILLGLGTIFFSGVFMDLDEESDLGTSVPRDTAVPEKQEWLNPDVSPVDADDADPQNKLVQGNEQISALEAQLQAQIAELNEAKGQAAEGAKERLRWEEVEKENSMLKQEMASLPVLQKENEKLKRELDSVVALKKELETLRSTVPEIKHSSAHEDVHVAVNPSAALPSGQPEDSMTGTAVFTQEQPRKPQKNQTEKNRDVKKGGHDIREKEGKERKKSKWKEGEEKKHKERGKSEWKNGRHEQGKFVQEKDKEGKQKGQSGETKQWKVEDWKKDKSRRGDQGKSWKDREGKKEWKEKNDRKWIDEKDWKKTKHEKVDEGKHWRVEEDKKVWTVRKEHGERHRSRDEWKGEKEWKKGKDGYKESGKDKWEKKEYKEKGEKKEWKKDNDFRGENKDYSKEGKWKGERKQWEENKNHGKENEGKDVRKQWNGNEWKGKSSNNDKEWKRKGWEKKEEQPKRGGETERKDWIKDKTSSQKHTEQKFSSDHSHEKEHVWGDRKPVHTHVKPSLKQPEYWIHQRQRFLHNPKSPQGCDSVETCAVAEGLLPVPLPEFEVILQTYLAKAEEAGVEASVREELRNLATEFFKDGVFVHDRMSFQDFVEDLGDVLEDMVEGDDEEEEDSDIEEDMEEFERAVMKKFSVPGFGVKEKRSKGEWRKESGRGHG
ncbi:pre-B-cell leukemia homeobox interacting protein 1b isoform X2 [Antennarius striatus]|uniref:pre-B-cell leukemia homeobox interacting protein 1b isoform X2 n=1 Tax=Antennarius striatus TaxID=241820 RepID=UPI0035B39A0E